MTGIVSAQQLLTALHACGAVLQGAGEALMVDAPRGILTEPVRASIRQHKVALLALLEAFEERAALMEYDGHLPRGDAERLAWACIIQEASLNGVHATDSHAVYAPSCLSGRSPAEPARHP